MNFIKKKQSIISTSMSHFKLSMLLQQAYLGNWYESVRQDENWMRFRKKIDEEQFDTYIKWINLQFSRVLYDKTGQALEEAKALYSWLRVTNLETDLQDGLRFIYLVEIIYDVTLSKEFGTKKLGCLKLHKMKNHDTCLNYLNNKVKLKCVGINSLDLTNGNIKMITGLLFLLKHDFESKILNDSKFIEASQNKLDYLRNSCEIIYHRNKLLSKSYSHINGQAESNNAKKKLNNKSTEYLNRLDDDRIISRYPSIKHILETLIVENSRFSNLDTNSLVKRKRSLVSNSAHQYETFFDFHINKSHSVIVNELNNNDKSSKYNNDSNLASRPSIEIKISTHNDYSIESKENNNLINKSIYSNDCVIDSQQEKSFKEFKPAYEKGSFFGEEISSLEHECFNKIEKSNENNENPIKSHKNSLTEDKTITNLKSNVGLLVNFQTEHEIEHKLTKDLKSDENIEDTITDNHDIDKKDIKRIHSTDNHLIENFNNNKEIDTNIIKDQTRENNQEYVETKKSNHFTELIDSENYLFKSDIIHDSLVSDYNFIGSKDDGTVSWSSSESKEEIKKMKSDDENAIKNASNQSSLNEDILFNEQIEYAKKSKNLFNDKSNIKRSDSENETDADKSIDSDYDSAMINSKTENDVELTCKSLEFIDDNFDKDQVELVDDEKNDIEDSSTNNLQDSNEIVKEEEISIAKDQVELVDDEKNDIVDSSANNLHLDSQLIQNERNLTETISKLVTYQSLGESSIQSSVSNSRIYFNKPERRNKKKRKYKPSYLLTEEELRNDVYLNFNTIPASIDHQINQINLTNNHDHSNKILYKKDSCDLNIELNDFEIPDEDISINHELATNFDPREKKIENVIIDDYIESNKTSQTSHTDEFNDKTNEINFEEIDKIHDKEIHTENTATKENTVNFLDHRGKSKKKYEKKSPKKVRKMNHLKEIKSKSNINETHSYGDSNCLADDHVEIENVKVEETTESDKFYSKLEEKKFHLDKSTLKVEKAVENIDKTEEESNYIKKNDLVTVNNSNHKMNGMKNDNQRSEEESQANQPLIKSVIKKDVSNDSVFFDPNVNTNKKGMNRRKKKVQFSIKEKSSSNIMTAISQQRSKNFFFIIISASIFFFLSLAILISVTHKN